MALLSLLARLGTSQPVEPIASLGELAETFDFNHFGRAPAHFDLHDVELLNSRLLHHLDFGAVGARLPKGATEDDWLLLRGNLTTLAEYADWNEVLGGDIAVPDMPEEDRAFCAEAAVVAVKIDWSRDPWHALAEHLKTFTGRKGRALFHPLRLALTGRTSGPEMAGLLKRIGKDRAIQRLKSASAR